MRSQSYFFDSVFVSLVKTPITFARLGSCVKMYGGAEIV